MRFFQLLLLFVFTFYGCGTNSEMPEVSGNHSAVSSGGITYLALGDSYTIGESVTENERWPMQLTSRLNEAGFNVQSPKIIAQTGWRTDDLLNAMNSQLSSEKYDLVSVLIGVNNQYQRKSITVFEEELKVILEKAISYSKSGKENVFMVSIPDYGVTPFGLNSGRENISQEIIEYNLICKQVAEEMDIPFYNITDISLEAETNTDLVAGDGLHPSGEMYRRWVVRILPKVKELLVE
jgi:lysophospholipase L1-like esterase